MTHTPELAAARDVEAALAADPILTRLLVRDAAARAVITEMSAEHGLTAPADAHFTALAYCYTGQQVPERQALRSIAALHEHFADQHDPRRLDAAAIATADVHGLTGLPGLTLSPRRRAWLVGLAAAVTNADLDLDLDAISRLDDDQALAALTAIPGIGDWSAGQFLFWHLRRVDHVPLDDPGLRHALAHVYGLDALPDRSLVAQISDSWRPYRSIAVKILLASAAGPGLSPNWPAASPTPGLPVIRRRARSWRTAP